MHVELPLLKARTGRDKGNKRQNAVACLQSIVEGALVSMFAVPDGLVAGPFPAPDGATGCLPGRDCFLLSPHSSRWQPHVGMSIHRRLGRNPFRTAPNPP